MPSPDDIRAALREEAAQPYGNADAARAGKLLADAESSGDRDLLVEALLHLGAVHGAGPDPERAFAPVSRLLAVWDADHGAFGPSAAHRLHAVFRRVTAAVLDRPHIPLETVERWHAQLTHRPRLAGYSRRSVGQSEFRIARDTGDIPRAERAHAAWTAAGRDDGSDCHACELSEQGAWQVRCGDDEAALRLWEPVLTGARGCAHEPHRVLAASLLPLLRLGRRDDARARHLSGYERVRAREGEDIRRVVARHVEFCALSGNESRGQEILAGRRALWDPAGEPGSLLDWMVCTALLMRRLTELGHAEQPVPGPPGQDWRAVTLLEHAADEALAVAARFDRRNGTGAVSDAVRARMGARPVGEPLSLEAGRPGPAGTRAEAGTPGPVDRADHVDPVDHQGGADHADHGVPAGPHREHGDGPGARALLTGARRLSEVGHPSAAAAWERLDDAVRRTGTRLSDGERAELLDHRAMTLARTDPAAATERFAEAAQLFTAAGLAGDSLACRARALLAGAFAGDARAALAGIGPLCSEAVSLHSRGRVGTRQATAVLLTRARIRAGLLADEDDPRRAAADLDAELAELIAFAGPHRDEPAVLARIADATESRGRLAGQRGDVPAATGLLAEAIGFYHAAGRPWQATEAELTLARAKLGAGAAEEAGALLGAVLADPRRVEALAPAESARTHLLLADALAAQQRAEEAADAFREAARQAAAAKDGAGLGARARLRFGGCCLDLGRDEEAAGVLAEVLPELVAGHGETEVVRARSWLGQALSRTGEHRAAVEQFRRAARATEDWTDQRDHATLVHLTADALADGGAAEDSGDGGAGEAAKAYERAEGLWRRLGETPWVIRAQRSRAWLAMNAEDRSGAVELMGAALREAESGLRAAEDEEQRIALCAELGLTYQQTAELVLQTAGGSPQEVAGPEQQAISSAAYREAVVFVDHAVAAFDQCGTAGLADRTGALLMAAWLELGLGRSDAATTRARTVLESFPEGTEDPDGVAVSRREEAAQVREQARLQGPEQRREQGEERERGRAGEPDRAARTD